MDWSFIFFPLVNAATWALKSKVLPRAPKWTVPLIAVGVGVGVNAAGTYLGIPGLDAHNIQHAIQDGLTTGGLASLAHGVVTNLPGMKE